uniref:Dentin sialophosphoprotein-like n=1 Tax=Saccoglossus kowalevskii TaxID=10224 RepID=A0ABM0M2G4_SACKO|nr:PREDICTED: dentin sialophosphoprotein-like [Saccoglossus kowalevskii]
MDFFTSRDSEDDEDEATVSALQGLICPLQAAMMPVPTEAASIADSSSLDISVKSDTQSIQEEQQEEEEEAGAETGEILEMEMDKISDKAHKMECSHLEGDIKLIKVPDNSEQEKHVLFEGDSKLDQLMQSDEMDYVDSQPVELGAIVVETAMTEDDGDSDTSTEPTEDSMATDQSETGLFTLMKKAKKMERKIEDSDSSDSDLRDSSDESCEHSQIVPSDEIEQSHIEDKVEDVKSDSTTNTNDSFMTQARKEARRNWWTALKSHSKEQKFESERMVTPIPDTTATSRFSGVVWAKMKNDGDVHSTKTGGKLIMMMTKGWFNARTNGCNFGKHK